MNLTVADRERLSGGAAAPPAPPAAAATRYLNSELSFYGVGSKNACFYLGRAVKVVTHAAGAPFVHELRIGSAELAARWEAHAGSAYEADMAHRQLRDARTLAPEEARHGAPVARWVATEGCDSDEEGEEGEEATQGDAARAAAAPADPRRSFTRVLMSDLAPAVFDALAAEGGAASVCRELAHIYHYYVHGEGGNNREAGAASGAAASAAASAAALRCAAALLPRIVVEEWRGGARVFRRSLRAVADDMETQLLRAARREFPFTVTIPAAALPPREPGSAGGGDGAVVAGVLRYYPCCGDRETLPLDDGAARRAKAVRRALRRSGGGDAERGGATQGGADRGGPTQGGPTQGGATQGGALGRDADGSSDEEGGGGEEDEDLGGDGGALSAVFETFWMGRLIPETHAPALPFIAAAFASGRSAADKDRLPACCARRLRGALFFGPALRVTRNKLSFRGKTRGCSARACVAACTASMAR
jgi:hypothetical protein